MTPAVASAPRARGVVLLAIAAGLLAALLLTPTSQAAPRQAPFGFLGVDTDGVLLDPKVPLDSEFTQMVSTGVESVRLAIYWSVTQPYPNAGGVPPDQASAYHPEDDVPTDWAASDRVYAAAAEHGLKVLPVILQAPPWARRNPSRLWSPPTDPQAFGHFVGLVARRYGPNGTFWSQNPQLPARPSNQWQIWNEPAGTPFPNSPSLFWADSEPFQRPYIAMLRAAHDAVKAIDPQGQVILGGLFGRGWLALRSLYLDGARGLFDAVSINIFTKFPQNVILALKLTRTIMDEHGDRPLPLLVTEFTWPSAKGRVPEANDVRYGYDVTPAQQARDLTTEVRLMMAARRRLKLQQVFWYTWLTRDAARDSSFEYAGLRHLNQTTLQITPKPAQGAFRAAALRIEGCAKRLIATTCG